jgi:hypothetical protein
VKLISFWDFNNTIPYNGLGKDSLGTVFSYANTLTVDSNKSTWPLYPNYTTLSPTGSKIEYYRPQKKYTSARDSSLDNGTPGAFYYDYSSSHYSYYHSSDSSHAGGNMFIRARNPSDSCEFYLYMPTTKYQNVQLYFAISASSSKAANYLLFSYSTNGGSTWNKLTQAMDTFSVGPSRTPDTLVVNNPHTDSSKWSPVQINFSSITAINNNPNFIVRFMLAGSNTINTSGNTRFDNFALMGDTDISTSINEVKANGGYNIYPNPAGNMVNLISDNAFQKIITVYNLVGQVVSVSESNNKSTTVNTSGLHSGIYFVNIKEVESGNVYTLKLIKD